MSAYPYCKCPDCTASDEVDVLRERVRVLEGALAKDRAVILESIIECGIALTNAGLVGDVELTLPWKFWAMAKAEMEGSTKFSPPPSFNGVPDPLYREPKLLTPSGLEVLKVYAPHGTITLRCGPLP